MFNSRVNKTFHQLLKYNFRPVLKLGPRPNSPSCIKFQMRPFCSSEEKENSNAVKKGGFAQAFEKFSYEGSVVDEEKEPTFLNLLRHSKFVDLGDPEGKTVIGTIFHVVEDDLYVDFGWKFHCVVPRPAKNGNQYVRGTKVRLLIKDLEMSSRFLGSEKDLTLLEADCTLLGIVYSPIKRETLSAS